MQLGSSVLVSALVNVAFYEKKKKKILFQPWIAYKKRRKKQIQNILPTQRLIKAPGVEINVIEGPVFDTCTFVQKWVKKVQVSRFVFAFILHLLRTPSTESAK